MPDPITRLNALRHTRRGDLRPEALCQGPEAWALGKRSVRVGRALRWAVLFCVACDPGPAAPVLGLPQRLSDAPGGAEIALDVRALDVEAREERIYREISQGNVPTWIRRLERVEMTGEVNGREHGVTFWVTRDYLAVGSDSDYVLFPLSPQTAQLVADLDRAPQSSDTGSAVAS